MMAVDCHAGGKWFAADKSADSFVNNLKVIFTKKLSIDCDYTWKPQDMGYSTIFIVGNGSTIKGNAEDRDEKKWVSMNGKPAFVATDLTIKNFNTAVECLSGTCYFNNIKFDNNRMDYAFDRDWGAAILNTGYVICDNCTFTNNYAKNGGAIFNQGLLELNNVTFKGNEAYGVGNDVCVGDGGIVRINGQNITKASGSNKGATAGLYFIDNLRDVLSHVYFAESMSVAESSFIAAVGIAAATVAGIVAGALTANAIIGVAVGFALGAAIGAGTAAAIISQHYDVNYNRLKTVLTLSIEGAVCGAIGGLFSCGAYSAEIDALASNEEFYITTALVFMGSMTIVFGGAGGLSGYLIND